MEISKTKRISLVEQVVGQIESLIKKEIWEVGLKIPSEMELMKQFDVSRNTLREAIRALVHAGMLQTKQGSGTYVRSKGVIEESFEQRLEKSTLIEVLEVRHALEREGAILAAERRTEKDLKSIKGCLMRCKEAKDIAAFAKADIDLHKAIVSASHNRPLIELYSYMANSLHDSVFDLIGMTPPTESDLDPGAHDELIGAISEKNAERAGEIVSDYIQRLKKTVMVVGEV